MSDMFEEEDELVEGGAFVGSEEEIDIEEPKAPILDARRELERRLEEKRLRDELNDFIDY